ncbi:MAG: hypothetical protein KatS3mg087_2012 [Patescibacteria group bacterium]|nr:MAG: hypothetical protein KatS3mg087_2012 [Patescibacteria group bacterium]
MSGSNSGTNSGDKMRDPNFIEYLRMIRSYELEQVASMLPEQGRILELGAGTGYQAKLLAQRGYEVIAIDLKSSEYLHVREWEVQVYDGKHIPCDSESIDCVFSSNVLEHVQEPIVIHNEIRRILKPNGFAVHIMPNTLWRVVNSLGRPARIPNRWKWVLVQQRPLLWKMGRLLRVTAGQLKVMFDRHGERGNVFSELWYFSATAWKRHFRAYGFDVAEIRPLGIFYTRRTSYGYTTGNRTASENCTLGRQRNPCV